MAGVDCQCQPFQQTLKKCFKYPVGKGQRNTTLAKAKAENVLSIKAMSGPHWQYIGWYIVLQRHLCYALNFHKAGRKYCTYSGKVSYTIFSDIRCRRWEEESQHTTGPVDRMLHRIINRKRRETKQQPSRAKSGNQISCCFVSLHFLCDILFTGLVHTVHVSACEVAKIMCPSTPQPQNMDCLFQMIQ